MENQKVHEYVIETGANGLPVARLGKVHHLVTVGYNGVEYTYLDGRFVKGNGQQMDQSTVPDEVVARVKEVPFKGAYGHVEQQLINCEFCADILASGQYARHLADKHVRPAQTNDNPIKAVETEAEPAVEGLDG